MLHCSKCHEEKPENCFSPDKRRPRGYQPQCKACRCTWQKQHDAPKWEANRVTRAAVEKERKLAISKRCTKCGKHKLLAAFQADARMVLGVTSACRTCRAAKCAEWLAANPRYTHERYWKDAGRARELALQSYRRIPRDGELWQKRAERSRETSRKLRRDTPELVRARNNAWRRANPEKMRIEWAKKRARKASVKSTLTKAEWDAIVESFDSRCAYCLAKLQKPTIDHLVAITRGGDHESENVVPCCQSCNSRKHNAPIWSMANTVTRANQAA